MVVGGDGGGVLSYGVLHCCPSAVLTLWCPSCPPACVHQHVAACEDSEQRPNFSKTFADDLMGDGVWFPTSSWRWNSSLPTKNTEPLRKQ